MASLTVISWVTALEHSTLIPVRVGWDFVWSKKAVMFITWVINLSAYPGDHANDSHRKSGLHCETGMVLAGLLGMLGRIVTVIDEIRRPQKQSCCKAVEVAICRTRMSWDVSSGYLEHLAGCCIRALPRPASFCRFLISPGSLQSCVGFCFCCWD